jgi:hypothetical protein
MPSPDLREESGLVVFWAERRLLWGKEKGKTGVKRER